jgi:diguanylate cyclase (GGDEF)-like protein
MFARITDVSMSLDVNTLFIVATCVTALLGVFLLFAWLQDRIRALAWWGCAYLIGGFSVAVWSIDDLVSPPLPAGIANALLFVACGMIWSAARVFHGRPLLWGYMFYGAAAWLIAGMFPAFAGWSAGRIILSSVIVATYTFLTASELWRERRKTLLRRWPAIFVPILHGCVFLFPVPLASLLPDDGGVVSLTTGWVAVFVLEVLLYVVGTAFIVLVLAKERTVRIHKTAALTDPLTGVFNRRGFYDAAKEVAERQVRKGEPVTVLMFDLDHFKRLNDNFGHSVGDRALRLFANTATTSLRSGDVVARLGGEEFVAILPGVLTEAAMVAERVRNAFEVAGVEIDGQPIGATVSVGAACGAPGADIDTLLARADTALYRAKTNGRNRVETSDEAVPGKIEVAPPLAPAASESAVMPGLLAGAAPQPAA